MNSSYRIQTLEPMRGIAALAVCWFHFTNGGNINTVNILKTSGAYGWLGVEIFFVISGFIIPLSMFQAGYSLKNDYAKFILKRTLRISPPYFASIVIVVLLLYLSSMIPGFAGNKPEINAYQILLHIFYLNTFFEEAWLNPVYWTLAIEFQYYLSIALLYPIIVHSNHYIRAGLIWLLCVIPSIITTDKLIFHYVCLFGLGIVSFQFYTNIIKKDIFFTYLLILTFSIYYHLGLLQAALGLATAIIIVFIRVNVSQSFAFLGSISYSLYLIHVPIGGRVVNLGGRFANTFLEQIVVFIIALVVSILIAYLMFLCIERPAQEWAGYIKYRNKKPKAAVMN